MPRRGDAVHDNADHGWRTGLGSVPACVAPRLRDDLSRESKTILPLPLASLARLLVTQLLGDWLGLNGNQDRLLRRLEPRLQARVVALLG